MAEKSLVNEPALMFAPPPPVVGEAAPDVGGDVVAVEDLELLLHAARPPAANRAAVRALTFLSDPLMCPPIGNSDGLEGATVQRLRRCRGLTLEPPPKRGALLRACSP
jgi:hypothetical protein